MHLASRLSTPRFPASLLKRIACIATLTAFAASAQTPASPPPAMTTGPTTVDSNSGQMGGPITIRMPARVNTTTVPPAPPAAAASAPARNEPPASEPRRDPTAARETTPREPEPRLTEFQKFVFESSGRTVPLFGYDLFGSRAFPSLTNVPVPTDYVIGPGDEVVLRLWGAIDADLRVAVDRNGQISLPRIGTFRVAGLRASQLQEALRSQVSKTFRNFEISATLGELRAIQVFVVGQARRPGAYNVSSLSSLLSALFEVGGPANTGTLRNIQLRRDGKVVSTMDLYKFIAEGDKSADIRLQPGDVIVIPPAGPRVALLGGLDNPAIFELAGAEEPLSRVLGYAGSLRALTSLHKVLIERVSPAALRSPRSVEERALDATGLAAPLRDGDVVTLFQISPQFSNAVTLRGNVAAPLRYAYKPGMRIADLIPEREALIQPDYYTRKNMLVQYESGVAITLDRTTSDVKNLLSEINWDYAVIERLDTQTLRTTLIPFNLGRAVLQKTPQDNLPLLPGDVVTVFSVKDIPAPRERSTRLVRVGGEVNAAGIYQITGGETLKSLLERAGGPTPQAYLFGTEFSREATRVKQREALADAARRLEATLGSSGAQQTANLGNTDPAAAQRLQAAQEQAQKAQLARLRTLQPNGRIALELRPEISSIAELPDLPLEDGDTILLPARPGFVFAVGAVANDNALLWRAGRTVKQYLMAAGLEPAADDDNIFIVRADGSIVHSRDFGGIFNNFDSMALAPGDTVVVPEKLNRETRWNSFIRGLKDWSQILSNFGLTAAAIHTLSK